jgi:hypothetical protein
MGFLNKEQLRGMMTAVKNHVDNKCRYTYDDLKRLLYYEVTYDELYNLKNSSRLIQGASYVINDYRATTVQEGTESSNFHDGAYRIVISADTTNRLNEHGKLILSTGPDLEFDIKYCFENDTNRFA